MTTNPKSPCCGVRSWGAGVQRDTHRYRCPKCGTKFTGEQERKVKYAGEKAGPIVFPQYRYGSTRLG